MEARLEGVRFDRGRRAVLDVPALTLASGRVTALVGPNGSGKTTLLRLLAGLERPSAGRVLLDGETPPRGRDSPVAFAFQEPVFLGGSLRANLDLGLRLRGLDAAERERRMLEAAAACGIAPLLGREARTLSGGEAQRANLARALALRAPITLLDEPLAGFDQPGRLGLLQELPEILHRFAATVVVVTHDRDEALRLADDLVVLLDGRVRAAGPKRAVYREPPGSAVAAFLGYTLLPGDAGTVAIAPGALRPGTGDMSFTLAVESVADVATHHEVAGRIAGVRVALPWSGTPPATGERVAISAPASAVRTFAEDPREMGASEH